jgi:hypothetical protein
MPDVFRANIAENSIYSTLRKIARILLLSRGGFALVLIEIRCGYFPLRRLRAPVRARPHAVLPVNVTKRTRPFD